MSYFTLASFYCLLNVIVHNEAARILVAVPAPSISHQVVFRPLIQELARRGHEVVVITPDPVFSKDKTPPNLTEIDVHNVSYTLWQQMMTSSSTTKQSLAMQLKASFSLLGTIFEKQLKTDEVQALINDKDRKFDLIFVEAVVRPALVFSYIYDAPVILISSLGPMYDNHNTIGAPTHPFLYPSNLSQKSYNLSFLDKVKEFFKRCLYFYDYNSLEEPENEMLRRVIGKDVPSLSELKKNVDMLFLNVHPIWEDNRPVPPSVVYMGGLPENPEKEIPEDLKSYMDSSKNGIIYISFGTNVKPSMMPKEKIEVLLTVFYKLPYNVLWKWDLDELPGRTENIRIAKWFPQADLLRHPNIKLFITQGGLQSTDDAIRAEVPLIGIPMFADQWYNTEKYGHHKIGLKLNIELLNERELTDAINEIINNESYRRNMVRLHALMYDQPQRPLERAVWWTEHVLRHGGGKHLRAPAANMGWAEYYELNFILILVSTVVILLALIIILLKCLFSYIYRLFWSHSKVKVN